ncbi:hypothetical protein LGH70_22225 [Hymenobacter sp. BT635]|uniref:Uncharacterized protein n=1 Tax=Hymenobacter nitidus TaxID=2880929 RepID=A0ABS8AIQ3_9BACT|nr:hypothetical protein [Hymenobacter nitidus]MCB2380325.1 hypothetical protein [Hymenobacter nitidus]
MIAPQPSTNPQLFTLIRNADETGISGTGRVLDGVIFHTGQVVVCWRSDLNTEKPGYSSLVIYGSWEAFKAIHIDPHPAEQTQVVFQES